MKIAVDVQYNRERRLSVLSETRAGNPPSFKLQAAIKNLLQENLLI